VKEVQASVVSFAVAIEESVETFTPERKSAIRSELAVALSCFDPACHIKVVVAAGSLNLNIIVTVPEERDGGPGVAPAVIESAEQLLNPQGSTTRLAAIFGATVISSSDAPTVQTGVPTLVPTDTMPPPPPTYTASAPSPNDAVNTSPPSSAGEAGFPIIVVVGVGGGAALCIAIALAAYVCYQRNKSRVAVRTTNDRVSCSSEDDAPSAQLEKETKVAIRVPSPGANMSGKKLAPPAYV